MRADRQTDKLTDTLTAILCTLPGSNQLNTHAKIKRIKQIPNDESATRKRARMKFQIHLKPLLNFSYFSKDHAHGPPEVVPPASAVACL